MKLLSRLGIGIGIVAALFGLSMAVFPVEQRTIATASFMASYRNSAPQIVIGVLSEFTLPYLHATGFVKPVEIEVDKGIRMHLDVRDLVPRNIIANGVYEPVTTQTIEDHLAPGGTFLDIGAHIGFHSLKAAKKVGAQGHVLSVEPNPDTLVELRRNVASSDAKQVSIQPVACGESEGTLQLFAGSLANTGMSSLAKKTAEADGVSGRQFQVRARPLDDIVKEAGLERVDVIKIDVEGAEMFVLKGGRQTIERFHPFLVMEVKEEQLVAMGTSKAAVFALLREWGYTPGRTFEGNMEFTYRPQMTRQ